MGATAAAARAPVAEGLVAEGLAAEGLTKRYGGRLAVDGVDLHVAAGQVHGLLGSNGAGKTTVLRMLLGLVRPDAGTIRLLGTAVEPGDGGVDGVASVLTAPAFHPGLTGRRTLQLLAGVYGGSAPQRVGYALEATGLTGRACDVVGGYSLGLRSRLNLAAALLRAPRLLLLDEPANGLDPAGRHDLRSLLRELAGDGVTVLLSSHDLDDVAELCDAVTVLQDGRVRSTGSMPALRAAAPAAQLHTSDDGRARQLAAGVAGLVAEPGPAGGLALRGTPEQLDAYVLLLGRSGVAVRALEPARLSLAALLVPAPATRVGP